MTEDGKAGPEPPEDEGNRNVENAVMLGFFAVLVGAGVWLLEHHGRCAKGAGLRRPGAPQLRDDRGSRPGAIDEFSERVEKQDAKSDYVDGVAGPDRRPGSHRPDRHSGGSSTAVKNQPVPQAPVGHRQPRAGDVPTEKNLNDPNDPLSKENAILDRKIKSICRGC